MTSPVNVTGESERATEIRNTLTDDLLANGMIKSSAVESAFRAVPREKFAPGARMRWGICRVTRLPGPNCVTSSAMPGRCCTSPPLVPGPPA